MPFIPVVVSSFVDGMFAVEKVSITVVNVVSIGQVPTTKLLSIFVGWLFLLAVLNYA